MEKVNISDKLAKFSEHWSPKIVGELNDSYVKLVKFQGAFLFHKHEHEDELFLVLKGKFTMRLRTGDVELREGEFFIVPKGVEHCPVAPEEVSVMLLEPKTTLNTGNVVNERTKQKLDWI